MPFVPYSGPIPQAAPPAVAKDASAGGFVPALKQGLAGIVDQVARPLEDFGFDTGALGGYSQRVAQENPVSVSTVSEFMDRPWTGFKEAVGQSLPLLAEMGVGGALGGAAGGFLGRGNPAAVRAGAAFGVTAPNFAANYVGNRQRQDVTGVGGPKEAAAWAIPQAAIDVVAGPERIIAKLAGGKTLAAAGSRGKALLSDVGIGATAEAITGALQEVGTQLSAGEKVGTPDSLEKIRFGALQEGVAGAPAYAAIGQARSFKKPAPLEEAGSPSAAEQQDEDDIPTAEELLKQADAPNAESPATAAAEALKAEVAPPSTAIVQPDGTPFKTTFQANAALKKLPAEARQNYYINRLGPTQFELRQRGAEGIDAGFIPTAVPEAVELSTVEPEPSTEGIEVAEAPAITLQSTPEEIAKIEQEQQQAAAKTDQIDRVRRMLQDAQILGDAELTSRLESKLSEIEPPPTTAGIEVEEEAPAEPASTQGISVGEVEPVAPPAAGFAVDPFGNVAGTPAQPQEVTSVARPLQKALPQESPNADTGLVAGTIAAGRAEPAGSGVDSPAVVGADAGRARGGQPGVGASPEQTAPVGIGSSEQQPALNAAPIPATTAAGKLAAAWGTRVEPKQGKVAPAPSEALAGEPTDKQFVRFADTAKSLNIPRAEMPQVKAEARGALTQFLAARGVEHEQEHEVDPATLKPTQAEFSPEKVQAAKDFKAGDRAILVSSDNRIVDGHHQWAAALDEGKPIRIIRLDAPIKKLLPLVHEFPSSTTASTPPVPKAKPPVAESAQAQPVQDERSSAGDAGAAKPKSGKPRMGETADDVWSAIKKSSREGVVSNEAGSRIISPTLRVVGGNDYTMSADGKLQVVSKKNGGQTTRAATPAETEGFHKDLDGDRVQVILQSPPGYGSGYGQQVALRELHSPSGNAFGKAAAAKPLRMDGTARPERAKPTAAPEPPADGDLLQPAGRFNYSEEAKKLSIENYESLRRAFFVHADAETPVAVAAKRILAAAGMTPAANGLKVSKLIEAYRSSNEGAFRGEVAEIEARITASTPPPSVRHWASVNPKGERGAAVVREALTKARDQNTIRPETADMALWLLDRNPNLAADLAVAIRPGLQNVAGSYNPPNRLITLFSGSEKPDTAVHEILHHSERMMPEDVQEAIHKEWRAAVDREMKAAAKAGDTKRLAAISALQRYGPDLEARARANAAFQNGTLTPEDYALANASEYWAVNATRILSERYAADSWQARAAQWLRDFIEKVRSILKLPPDDPILRGLRAVLKASGEQVSGQQLNRRSAESQQPGDTQTETPAFEKWFGQSVVTENGKAGGKPLVVYHGTMASFDAFDPDSVGRNFNEEDSQGFFFSSGTTEPNLMAGGMRKGDGGNVMPVFLALQNPFVVNLRRGESGGSATAYLDQHKDEIISAANEGNRDGVIVNAVDKDGGKNSTYVAFRPEQIKSAIGNRGTFDPSDPNILYQPAAGSGVVLPDETRTDVATRRFVDKMNRWKGAQEYLEKVAPGVISDATDVYSKEMLYYGKADEQYKGLKRKYIDPITKLANKSGITLKQIDDFLRASHAPERNALIAKRNPAMPDGGSGLTNKKAAAVLASFSAAERQALDQIGNLVWAMNREKLAGMKRAGLISAAEYEILTKQFSKYVPLKTIDEDDENWGGIGRGYDVRGKEYKAALGRMSEATSPLLVSVQDANRSIIREQKAAIGKAVYQLAKDSRAKDVLEVADPSDFTIRVLGSDGKVKTQIDPNYSRLDEIFATKIDGETKYVLIKDAVLAQQLKKMGEAQLTGAMELIGRATSLMGRMMTQYNIAFTPINAIRDAIAVTINSLSIPGLRAPKILANIGSAVRGIATHNLGGTSPWATHYKAFLEDGASTGGLGLDSLQDLQREIQEAGVSLERPGDISAWRRFISVMTKLGAGISRINETVENAARLSTYVNAIEAGQTRQQAAVLAKEISVNFNKRGEYSRALNALFVFFNAAVQGLRGFRKFSAAPEVKVALVALMVMGAMARVWNDFAGMDDDLEEDKEKALSDAARTNSIPIILGDKVALVPIPYIFNVVTVFGYRGMDAAITGNYADNILGLFKAALASLSPIGEPQDASTVERGVMKTFTPTLLKPLLESALNEGYEGRILYPAASQFDRSPPPPSERYYNSASVLGKTVAKALNTATGGDSIDAGWFSVSPAVFDHIVGQYLSGPARVAGQAYNSVAKAVDPNEDVKLADIPIVSRLARETRGEYYVSKRYNEIADAIALADKYADAKMRDKADPDDLRMLPVFKSADKRLRDLYKQRAIARDKDQDARVKQIEGRIDQERERFIKSYNMSHRKFDEALGGADAQDASVIATQAGYPAAAQLFGSLQGDFR